MRYLILIAIFGLMPADTAKIHTVRIDTSVIIKQQKEMSQDIDSIQFYIKDLITKLDSIKNNTL